MRTETIGEIVISEWGGIGWAIPRGLDLTRRGRWSACRAALALAWDFLWLPPAVPCPECGKTDGGRYCCDS